jgi:hypothetical protein
MQDGPVWLAHSSERSGTGTKGVLTVYLKLCTVRAVSVLITHVARDPVDRLR